LELECTMYNKTDSEEQLSSHTSAKQTQCLSIHDERAKLNGVKNLLACVISLVEKYLANSI